MSVPFVPSGKTPVAATPSQPAPTAQQQKVLEDIQVCVYQLKQEFTESRKPINDDNQTLHRFCGKLEYLLQAHMKDRYSMLGKKKDYWDYFCDCLGSTKGLNDGIKYVKSIGEHKQSLGKGRAFLRFSLVHQRLPDSIQQCVTNQRTSDWYHPQSFWHQSGLTLALINSLYDLNDLHFDLSPRGYDLDTTWPSFAKQHSGSFNWNPPSRRSSISSMASLSMQDTSSLMNPDNSAEVEKLTHDLEFAESNQSMLQDQVESLQQAKLEVTQSVWSTQGELHTVQEQLRNLQEQYSELQEKYKDLQKRHNRFCMEAEILQKDWKRKEDELISQLENVEKEKKNAEGQLIEAQCQVDDVKKEMAAIVEKRNSDQTEKEAAINELLLQLKAVQYDLGVSKELEKKKEDQVESFEKKLKAAEDKNRELLERFDARLQIKEEEASGQMDAANKLQQVVEHLKDVDLLNTKLQASNDEWIKKFDSIKKELSTANRTVQELEDKLEQEKNHSKELDNLTVSLKEELCKNADVNRTACESLQAKLEEKESEVNSAKQEIEVKSSEITEINSETKEINKLFVQCIMELKSLASCDVSVAENDKLSCLDVPKLMAEVKMCKDCLSEHVRNLEHKIADVSCLRDSMEEQCSQLQRENQEVQKAMEDVKKAHSELQGHHAKVEEELREEKDERVTEQKHFEVELRKKETDMNNEKEKFEQCISSVRSLLKECSIDSKVNLVSVDIGHVFSLISLHVQKLSTKMSDVEAEKEILLGKLSNLHAGDTDKERQLNTLEEKFQDLQNVLGTARETESNLRTELVEKEKQLKDNREALLSIQSKLDSTESELSELNAAHEKRKDENVILQEQVVALKHDFTDLRTTMTATDEKLQKTALSQNEAETRRSVLEGEIEKMGAQLKEKEASHEKLEIQHLNFITELKDMVRLKAAVEEEKVSLQSQVNNVMDELATSSSKITDLEQLLGKEKLIKQEIDDKLKTATGKIDVLQKKLEESEKSLTSQEAKYEEAVQSYEAERNQLTSRLEEALNDTLQIKDQLKQTSFELEEAYSLKERIEKEKDELGVILENLERNYSELKAKLNLYQEEGKEMSSEKESLEEERERLTNELNRLQDQLRELAAINESNLNRKDIEIENLISKMEESEICRYRFETNVVSLEESSKSLQDRLMSAEQNCDALKGKLEQAQESLAEKECENDGSTRLIDSLKQSVVALESALDEKVKKCDKFETEQTKLQLQVESLTQEISALQFQLSAEQLQHEEALKSFTSQELNLSDSQSRLTEQEGLISELEQEMTSLQLGHKEATKSQEQQLLELNALLQSREEECQALSQRIQSTTEDLADERSIREKLQVELGCIQEGHNEQMQMKDEEISTLKSDIHQLKKHLIKMIRDKDTLWQKTDQLTYEQKIQASEKWMDNNTVLKCLGCKTEFSIWVRRHHCRLCGKIFCYNCSNNWLMTAHSSKKERACNMCCSRLRNLTSEGNSTVLSSLDDDDLLASISLQQTESSQDQSSFDQDFSSNQDGESQIESDFGTGSPSGLSFGTPNDTDDHKTEKMQRQSPHPGSQSQEGSLGAAEETDDLFHVITDEEVSKSLTEYDTDAIYQESCPNMQSSMILSATELETGEINRQNEVWIKPGRKFAVPISVNETNTLLCWEFTSQPKDVVFSVTHREHDSSPFSESQDVVQPCKCDSHKQPVKGELTVKQPGLYTLMFDNTYSRMTSKRVHYLLQSKKSNLSTSTSDTEPC